MPEEEMKDSDTNSIPVRIMRYVVMLRRFAGVKTERTGDSQNRWTVRVVSLEGRGELPEGTSLAVVFVIRGRKRMTTDIELMIDGEKQPVGDLSTALSKLLTDNPKADGMSSVSSSAKAARSNSVETRRSTVIRV